MIDTFGIPLAFIIIAALTLWVVLGCKGYWWLKMITISLSIFFSISLWNSLVSLQGWPTAQTMPEKFEVKWLDVKEPNKKTGQEGCIYVWAKDLEPNSPPEEAVIPLSIQLHAKKESGEPRLYKLPYSRGMHQQAEGIKQMIGKGGRFYGTLSKGKKGTGMSQLEADGKKGKGKSSGRPGKGRIGQGQKEGGSLSEGQEFVFHELPPPLFPEKEPSSSELPIVESATADRRP